MKRRRHGPLGRLVAIARKEVMHILRDRATLGFALIMPVLLLALFGYGVSFDVDRITTIVVDEDRSPASRAFLAHLFSGPTFERVGDARDASSAEAAFRQGDARLIVVVPRDYGRDLANRQGRAVQLLVDAADNQTAGAVLTYSGRFAAVENARLAVREIRGPTIDARSRALYNPALRSSIFLVPGLIALIESMMAVLLTALTVAREWERGSMEQLFATPVGRFEVVAGKLVPYFFVALVQLLFVVAAATLLFEVPVRGSFGLLLGVASLFLVAMLGQGLVISVVTKNQMVATQAAAISSMMPTMLLSGFVIPIDGMPEVLQIVTRVLPARYFVHAARSIMLRGAGWETVAPDVLALALAATFFVGIAVVRFQRRVA